MVLQEQPLFLDDVGFIMDMLKDNWTISDKVPTFSRETDVESFMMDARLGSVFVYSEGRRNTISTIDYRTLQRISRISVRVTTRFWEVMQEWGQEVYRILYSHRRMGYNRTNGYGYFEVLSDNLTRDLSGWYVTTFEIQMTAYATPLRTDGFGYDEHGVKHMTETFEVFQAVPKSKFSGMTVLSGPFETQVYDGVEYLVMTGTGEVRVDNRTVIEIYDVVKAELDVLLLTGQSNTFYYSSPDNFQGDITIPPCSAFFYGTSDVRPGLRYPLDTCLAIENLTETDMDTVAESGITDILFNSMDPRVACSIPETLRAYYESTGRRAVLICTGKGGRSVSDFLDGGYLDI